MSKLKEPFSLKPEYPNSPIGQPVDASSGIEVYLPDVSGLECLPASGEITFRFVRRELGLKGDDLSARICLESILGVKCDPEEEDKMSDVVDQLFEQAAKAEQEEKAEGAEEEEKE